MIRGGGKQRVAKVAMSTGGLRWNGGSRFREAQVMTSAGIADRQCPKIGERRMRFS
jgi:hypothetical protein